MFERREDGRIWPKRWTRSRPPAPASNRFWSWPFVVTTGTAALGLALFWLGEQGLSLWLFWGGVLAAVVYVCVDVRRWWHNVRWLNSPPTDPTPEDWR